MRHFSIDSFIASREIEQHLSWKGKIDQKTILTLLNDQEAFTYVLSKADENGYLLSYIRGKDRKVINIHFTRVFNRRSERNGYKNGCGRIFSSLEALIRFKLKGKGISHKAASMRISA